MSEAKVAVKFEKGLNAEMAVRFVQIASKYTSRIMVHYEDKEVNAKSIMSLLTLAIAPGDELTLKAKGEDADAAIKNLVKFIETGADLVYNLRDS